MNVLSSEGVVREGKMEKDVATVLGGDQYVLFLIGFRGRFQQCLGRV